MEKKEKRIYLYITFAIGLFALVTHLDIVIKGLVFINDLFMPVIVGLIIAFVLNVPVTGFENMFRRLFKKIRKKPSEKIIHTISIFLSITCVALIITLLCVLVIPELIRTVKSIVELVENNWPIWLETLGSYGINTEGLKELFSTLDLKNMLGKVPDYAGTVIGSIASAASSTVSIVSITITGIIIALYTLADRDKLAIQAKSVLFAYSKPAFADKTLYVCTLVKKAYTKFLTGQCVEAVLLGVLITVSFAIFRLPYALLVGAVTAICALIPYIGAFISCALGVILALMVSPQKALLCLIVYLSVQFIETQFIYPRVVGGSVGLSPLWTFVAVLIGGKLFGLMGMIFFIPLVSVIYVLVKEDVSTRLKNNEMKKKEAKSNETIK